MNEGEVTTKSPYDDKRGMANAERAFRKEASKQKLRVSRIFSRCEFDFARREWKMHYWVDVLGWAKNA